MPTSESAERENSRNFYRDQGDMQNGTNYLNGLDYSDSRDAFLIRGASGIAVETDFAAGSGPARQARARL
jgi:hypothetical protein